MSRENKTDSVDAAALEQLRNLLNDAAPDMSPGDGAPPTDDTQTFAPSDSAGSLEVPLSEPPLPHYVDRYRVRRVLGQGGFGRVLLAHDPKLNRLVAIKEPFRQAFASSSSADAYEHEARTAGQLKHPGLVTVHDVVTIDSRLFIIQEYIDGLDLGTWSRQCGQLDILTIIRIMIEIAEAIGYAHQHSVFHRDLKPGNILIDRERHVHITDFGLAVHESTLRRMPRDASGTPPYMSPEQVRGETHRLDGRTDIWSLGVILYELLVQRRPFSGSRSEEVFREILTLEPRPLRQIDPQIPAELERICMKCLAKRPSERYASAADLLDDLHHVLEPSDRRRELADPAAVGSTAAPTRIVPKGLRSFDERDADFFLELLPGPRDRYGLPDVIRHWKAQIEETDPEKTFTIGLLYGPSGCGKSSLVKAGILPRLDDHIAPVFIEATAHDTEVRIARHLPPLAPHLPGAAPNLTELMRSIRVHGLSGGRKLLLVLDQFEQWLHSNRVSLDAELITALRQCDGTHLQCIALVRDDFGMAAARFMDAVESPIVQGRNFATVDLFDVDHARKVLILFGRAFGRLPNDERELTVGQRQFVDAVASGLAQEGKVVSVQLALFAEMVKSKPWTLTTLHEVGGTQGVGVNFLEDKLGSHATNPKYRRHQHAARRLLADLLPPLGTNIKGHLRSRDELLATSPYRDRPELFEELTSVLDGELRLITPTDSESESDAGEPTRTNDPVPRYQLTHDYLVPALRSWLTQKQRETRRGRAELMLAERAAFWAAKPEDRHLPTWYEYLQAWLLVPKNAQTEIQQRMMRRSTRIYGIRLGTFALVAAVLLIGVQQFQAHLRRESLRTVVNAVATAQGPELPRAVARLQRFPEPLVLGELHRSLQQDENTPGMRMKLAFALAEYGRLHPDVLLESIATAPAEEAVNLVHALGSKPNAVEKYLKPAARMATEHANWKLKTRLAVLALHLGSTDILDEMLAETPDPTQRTMFITHLASWPGDLNRLAEIVAWSPDGATRSAVALAMGSLQQIDHETQSRWERLLETWYREAPDSATHSAAGWALRAWGKPLPHIPPRSTPQPGYQWFVTPTGLTLLHVDAGTFVRVDESPETPFLQTVTITRPYWLSDTEITVQLYREFIEDESYPGEKIPWSPSPLHSANPQQPAGDISWYSAVMFCNWLSWKEGLKPCYERTGSKDIDSRGMPTEFDGWLLIEGADGYRLPTDAEWIHACQAGSATLYSIGDSEEFLDQYAVFGQFETPPVGSRKCNRWGFFDMHGNMTEWCHDWYESFTDSPVRDPSGPLAGYSRVMRGSSFQNTAFFQRSHQRQPLPPGLVTIEFGFRVVRN